MKTRARAPARINVGIQPASDVTETVAIPNMDQESFENIARDPNIIPGIHNYCDRWCERCPKTARCSVFALVESETTDPQTRDAENEAFWDSLQQNFDRTPDMAGQWEDEDDFEIDQAAYDEYLALREHVDDYTKGHPIIKTAETYRRQVYDWFQANQATFEHRGEDIRKMWPRGGAAADAEAALWELSDIVDVIVWYHTLILAKLHRAVHQVIERDITGEEDITGDSDGSAKIALIGMDRSLYAWNVLRKHLRDHENEIGNFQAQVERLRRQTEQLFPKARAFFRPGLDEPC
jgi:hypothetical protein